MKRPDAATALIERYPGLKLEEQDTGDMFSLEIWGAITSGGADDAYRYMLWRIWEKNGPYLIVMMLNPSKADARINDQTISILIGRAKQDGYAGLIVVNAFALRATDPDEMKGHARPIEHADGVNDAAIEYVLCESGTILCAWGAHITHNNRDKEVACQLKAMGKTVHYLLKTKNGIPRHPLRIAYAEPLKEWNIA